MVASPTETIAGPEPKFVLDTNVVLAYLNPKDQFHLEAKTAIDGLKLKGVHFVLLATVIGECIAHRNLMAPGNVSIQKALTQIDRLQKLLGHWVKGGPVINLENITGFYKKHARHWKLTGAGFVDFMILVAAEEINNVRILTCDKDMCTRGRHIFADRIYYLPNRSPDMKSDYPRLMSELQNSSFK